MNLWRGATSEVGGGNAVLVTAIGTQVQTQVRRSTASVVRSHSLRSATLSRNQYRQRQHMQNRSTTDAPCTSRSWQADCHPCRQGVCGQTRLLPLCVVPPPYAATAAVQVDPPSSATTPALPRPILWASVSPPTGFSHGDCSDGGLPTPGRLCRVHGSSRRPARIYHPPPGRPPPRLHGARLPPAAVAADEHAPCGRRQPPPRLPLHRW